MHKSKHFRNTCICNIKSFDIGIPFLIEIFLLVYWYVAYFTMYSAWFQFCWKTIETYTIEEKVVTYFTPIVFYRIYHCPSFQTTLQSHNTKTWQCLHKAWKMEQWNGIVDTNIRSLSFRQPSLRKMSLYPGKELASSSSSTGKMYFHMKDS